MRVRKRENKLHKTERERERVINTNHMQIIIMVPIYYNIYSIQCMKSSHKDYMSEQLREMKLELKPSNTGTNLYGNR